MAAKQIFLWLWLFLLGVAHASASVLHAPENRVGDFFNVGYDAVGHASISYDGSKKLSSAYDVALSRAKTDNERRTEAQRTSFALFGRLLAAKSVFPVGYEGGPGAMWIGENAEKFFIENGVRRALVSREAGLTEIPATIFKPGQALTTTTLRLDQLMSPKTSVPMDTRYFNITPPIRSPIQVQPYGLPGQPPSIPLGGVGLE